MENLRVFDAQDFIAEVTQHIPLPRVRLVRYENNQSRESLEIEVVRSGYVILFEELCYLAFCD